MAGSSMHAEGLLSKMMRWEWEPLLEDRLSGAEIDGHPPPEGDAVLEARIRALGPGQKRLTPEESPSGIPPDACVLRFPSSSGLIGPFVFSDNTDFEEGWELDDEEEVFAFFRRREYLLRPEEWGNCYSCSLLDDNQRCCWVAVNHQGEMRLYPE